MPSEAIPSLFQGPTAQEWVAAQAAVQVLGKTGVDLDEQFQRCTSCLVMDFVPGLTFAKAQEPFQSGSWHQTASDLARHKLSLSTMALISSLNP